METIPGTFTVKTEDIVVRVTISNGNTIQSKPTNFIVKVVRVTISNGNYCSITCDKLFRRTLLELL